MTIEPRRRPLALSSLLLAALSSADCAPSTANARPAPPSTAPAEPALAASTPGATATPSALEKPPSKALTEAEFVSELEKRMRDAATEDEFSGVVLVARGGEPIFQKALGLADREQGIPNQLNTKFNIASMNKMFTAVVILQLVQAGKVALSDPLGKYLKGYPNADVAQQVTIEHLLTHTGGTGDIHGPEFAEHRRELRALGDYVKLFGKRGLAFAPGSQWEYSNYGFILLGAVIEKVTGQSYYDAVAQRVYAPAGMKNTG